MTIFAKVNVELLNHHRILRIPAKHRGEALGAWLAALLYSRQQELDGFCPLDAIGHFATRRAIDCLVDVGLVSREEKDGLHGVTVLRYSDHNETREQIAQRRASDRHRKRTGIPTGPPTGSGPGPNGIPTGFPAQGIPGSGSGSDSGSSEGDPGEPLPTPEPGSHTRLRNATGDGAFGMAVSAWCEGIAQATGKPFVGPLRGPTVQLVEAITRHRGNAEPVAWARATAKAFVAATPGGIYDVFRFVSWLNSNRPSRPGEAPGLSRAERIAKEKAEDAARRKRDAGAGGPPKPLSTMVAEARAKLGGGT